MGLFSDVIRHRKKPAPLAPAALDDWQVLESISDRPEAQAEIRRAIFRDEIRVVPGLDGKVRIIPLKDESD